MTTYLQKDVYEKLVGKSIDIKTNKYRNKKVVYDNIKFDSIKEQEHYKLLKLLEKAGIIKELELQKRFELQPSFMDNSGKRQKAITYIADFFYYETIQKIYIAEDVKSEATKKDKVYNLKKKMFMYQYPNIVFKEIM